MNNDHIDKLTEQVLAEVTACVRLVPRASVVQAAVLIENAPRVFVAGAGRSGLCMRALAMRLMHLGKTVFVAGETTTPSIAAGDLLVLGSGSGLTASLLAVAGLARQQGASILLFTADSKAPLARLADQQIIIPAPISEDGNDGGRVASAQPLGTLFEQALFIVNDRIILEIMQQMDVEEAQMAERHANLQ